MRFTKHLIVTVLWASLSGVPAAWGAGYSELYVFGDSLSDTGNIFALSGQPSAPYYQGHFADGPVWPEYLASQLGLDYNPSANFAVGGAHSDSSNSFGPLPGLKTEVDTYLAASAAGDPRGLYVIWAGANDFLSPGSEPSALITRLTANLLDAVQRLYEHGARRLVVVNVPDLGKTPRALASGLGPVLTGLVAAANQALRQELAGLPYPVAYIDAFAIQNRIIAQPAQAGLDNIEDACLNVSALQLCQTPQTYLYWDDIHMTSAVHAILADEFARVAAWHRYQADGNLVNLPRVQVAGLANFYRAQLHLNGFDAARGLYLFDLLTESVAILDEPQQLGGAALFDPGQRLLTVPEVEVQGQSYRAVLNFVPPARFELPSANLSAP